MPVTAAELAKMLNEHIEKYGDGPVMIYDDYAGFYKPFSKRKISLMQGNRFVIECEEEDDL